MNRREKYLSLVLGLIAVGWFSLALFDDGSYPCPSGGPCNIFVGDSVVAGDINCTSLTSSGACECSGLDVGAGSVSAGSIQVSTTVYAAGSSVGFIQSNTIEGVHLHITGGSTLEGIVDMGSTVDAEGPMAVGSAATTTSGAAVYGSNNSTGLPALFAPAPVGVMGDQVASGSTTGVGVAGLCSTYGGQDCHAIQGWATVTASGDTGTARASYFLSSTPHAGGTNMAIEATAALGTNNYALYSSSGSIHIRDEIESEETVGIKEWPGGPTPKTDYMSIWTDSDNRMEFYDGDGNPHTVHDERNAQYFEMFIYNSSTVQNIEAINSWHGMINCTLGDYDASHWLLHACTTFIATSTANDGGSVRVTYNNHGLDNGDLVTLVGWPTLDDIYVANDITANAFTIGAAWPGSDETDANSRVIRPSQWEALTGADGIYFINAGFSISPGSNNDVFELAAFRTTLILTDGVSRITATAAGDYSNLRIGSVTTSVTEGDRIFLAFRNLSSTADPLIKHGNGAGFKID